jgi:hypothetical protein
MFKTLYVGTNGKKTALALIDKLFTTAEDPNAGMNCVKKRQFHWDVPPHYCIRNLMTIKF